MTATYIPLSLRRLIAERAGGRCEYCLMPEPMALAAHEVDHVIPLKHGGATSAENLALSCALCNKQKGSDLASIDGETGALTPLFNPRRDPWSAHFELLPDGQFGGRTAIGRVTLRLLRLNEAERIEERALLIAAGAIQR